MWVNMGNGGFQTGNDSFFLNGTGLKSHKQGYGTCSNSDFLHPFGTDPVPMKLGIFMLRLEIILSAGRNGY